MLNNIKLWLYGAAAGLIAILYGWLKLAQSQRDKAKIEADKQAQARMAESAKHKQATNVLAAQIKAKQEAQNVENENKSSRGKRPAGNFGDKRL